MDEQEFSECSEDTSYSITSSRYQSFTSNDSLLRCFKEEELSSSSVFNNPLFYLPEPENPGIFEALRYEPPLEIDNDIGCERYRRICKILVIPPLKRILQYLDQNELDLSYYGLRVNELQALFYVLEMNAYVKSLKLGESFMEVESVHLLSQMLAQNYTITSLSLRKCNIGPQGAKALNEGLHFSTTLKELDLSFNFICDDGLCYLTSALKANESLKKINLGNNTLSSDCARYLHEIFYTNEILSDVNLEWNTINEDGAIKLLAAGLKSTDSLISLNLSWNGLGSDVVAKELGRYIRESNKLEFIDLSNNMFTGASLAILKKALGSSVSLKHVKLGNNPITPTEASTLGSLLLGKKKLEILNLENVYFPKSFNANLKRIKKTGKTLIMAGILGNFVIKGPDVKEVLLKRCHYLGLAPKRAKAKRDFGQIVLTLPQKPMDKTEFEQFVRKKKKGKMYDFDLLAEIRKNFASGTKIDTEAMLAEYMKLYPDTALPPPKKKKKKGKKGKKDKKGEKKKSLSKTEISTKVDSATLKKVSFSEPPIIAPSTDEPLLVRPRSIISQSEVQDGVPVVRKSSLKPEVPEKVKSGVTIDENVEVIST